ncbi:MAG: hypothetical protein IKZ60_04375 [Bacteroidales bacterium]|nr:hypothetical protein [Bacteroidales bacterium]
MRSLRSILLFVLLLAVSCQKERAYVEQSAGLSSIILKLDSSTAIRMETKTPTDLQEGLEFKNLLVILTDNTHKVVGKVTKTYTAPYPEDDLIEFDDLLPGNYTAYAYANYDAEDWQDDTVTDEEYTVTVGDENYDNDYLDRELLTLTGTNAPKDPTASPAASSMLLTGKLDIPLGLNAAEKTLYLTRPVVRFKVTVHNYTPFSVTVHDLSFSHFNPDRAYLLDHSSDGIPGIPSGVTYRELPAYNSSSPATVSANNEGCVYSTLLYENASPYTYKVFASLTLNRHSSDPGLNDLDMSLGGGGFGVVDYNTVHGMDEGEHLDVLMINPRTTTRGGRLFYGIGDTGLAWESCGYSTYDRFFARAQAIYREASVHEYQGFTYTGFKNDKSGLAGWSGNAADAPLTYTDEGTKKYFFNYSGKRSTYFHRLTKTGGKYTLDGLTTNPPSGTSISQMSVAPCWFISGRFPTDIPNGAYVQFVNDNSSDSNYGKYLRADNAYNASTEAAAKLSTLSWDNGAQNQHDHMFILFASYGSGAALNRMLKDNNKSVPLTYMSRNEEVNVVINVYYADQAGTLNFVVDNSTWTTATGVSHTFN